MAIALIKTEGIIDWQSFHETFRREMGFPDFYGMNMNAWIDCLSYLDEGDAMTRFHLEPGEMMNIQVTGTKDFKARAPEIFDALIECTAAVNRRYGEQGKGAVLSLIFL